jgi:branched-chain amino acid transport system substrate-binding protein
MVVVAVVAATAATMTACSSSGTASPTASGDATPYNIGVLTSQTGAAASLGVGELQGAQLAAAKINADGGVNGHKIKLIAVDDKSAPDQALQRAKSLASQNVAAIVGPSVVGNCLAIQPVIAAKGPVNYCLSPAIAKPTGYVWSASADITVLSATTISYWKKHGIKRIGIISTTDASGTTGAAAATAAAKKAGITIAATATYDPTAVSVTSQLQQATAGKPQALMVWATGASAGVAFQGIQQLGIDIPVMTTDGNLSNTFLQRIKDYTPKMLIIPATRDFWWRGAKLTSAQQKLEKDYHDAYAKKYGEQPDFGPGVAYDAVLLTAEALRKAESTDPAKVRAAMESIKNFDGVVATYNFSATDHRGVASDSAAIIQVKDGTYTYLGK